VEDKFEIVLKETVVAYFEGLSRYFPDKPQNTLAENSQYPGQDLN
jgi:hypothetical protein